MDHMKNDPKLTSSVAQIHRVKALQKAKQDMEEKHNLNKNAPAAANKLEKHDLKFETKSFL